MVATGFANSFNSGEISEDAWDRTDIQPVAKGCEEATNYMVRIAGPLGKRRGFWNLGHALNQSTKCRLVPFRRSVDDALMLEFGNGLVRVWNNNGQPLVVAGSVVEFANPYSVDQLPGLRWKQVGDVIYFRHRDGLRGRTLQRISNSSWTWTTEFYPNGPWLPENTNTVSTITVTGTDELDANPDTGAGSIAVDQVVDLVATDAIFTADHVGGKFRLRQTDGSPGVKAWAPGNRPGLGFYCVSNGRVYRDSHNGSFDANVTNPPVVLSGSQSDGANMWDYRHDGAGVVRIDVVTDANNAQGTVRRALPFKSGTATPYWAEGAWSDRRGWPRMWPSVREERLVEGATASNLDFLDLSETAGFTPINESFSPGLGNGSVIATDAVRRRLGADGAELIWSDDSAYLIVGSTSGEYLVAGSVLDQPISPTSVVVKQLSDFGSADVYPAKAHKGLIFVTRGGQTLRELAVDTGQGATGDDLTVLARHIADRTFVQLAWVPTPDETLWLRLADGGLASMVYHKEQQVRGFTRQLLAGGFTCEDMAVLPGPGRLETLWMIVSREKDGATQRLLWMYSRVSDNLFMDCAAFYSGPARATISGLDDLEGEAVRVVADDGQIPDPTVTGGAITLPQKASVVRVGLGYKARFKSLRLDTQLGGALNQRQRVIGVTVSLKTALASVGLDGAQLETVNDRKAVDIPAMSAKRTVKDVTIAGDTQRDPRLVIEDDTAYDCVVYSLKPKVNVGA